MKRFPDISEYYQGELAEAEERAWIHSKEYQRNLDRLSYVLNRRASTSVVEVGCGSGFIPRGLPASVRYLGIDNNPTFLDWARRKNPDRRFEREDIRNLNPGWFERKGFGRFDVATTFAVLKHFGHHEWDDVFRTILSLAPVAVFDIQITDRDWDNGTKFHHTFITHEHLERVVDEAGHRIASEVTAWEGPFPEGELKVLLVETEKA